MEKTEREMLRDGGNDEDLYFIKWCGNGGNSPCQKMAKACKNCH